MNMQTSTVWKWSRVNDNFGIKIFVDVQWNGKMESRPTESSGRDPEKSTNRGEERYDEEGKLEPNLQLGEWGVVGDELEKFKVQGSKFITFDFIFRAFWLRQV